MTSLAFWLALGADSGGPTRKRVATSLLFAATLATCVMLRTAAISIIAGAIAWIGATWLMERGALRRRLRWLAPALLVGVVVQGIWMVWAGGNEISEWPLGGYPKSYLSQLRVVNGNRPELGDAGAADWVHRIGDNLLNYTTSADQLLTHHWILPDWGSPAISAALGLLLVGLVASLLERAGHLHDFAFVASAAMVVVWPWDVEVRFILPLLPLACWYVWRGTLELGRQARLRRRRLGTALIAVSVPLAAMAGSSALRLGTIQPVASSCFWIAVAAAGLWVRERGERLRLDPDWGALAPRLAGISLALGIGGLVLVGVIEELAVARWNLAFEVTKSPNYSEIQAATWLREHADERAVLMAREVAVVHHLSGRKVVWLPPLSDTDILMEGIRRHGVQWVVVTDKNWSYWLPKESDVFQGLLAAHSEAFQLEAAGPRWRVFRVTSGASTPGSDNVAAGRPGSSPHVMTP
ncbi:MAG TPA: hypothetical protein VMW19_06240 [Myxococcota bacterium]|nr:hypothetical protein [Myxococcota bacterium]